MRSLVLAMVIVLFAGNTMAQSQPAPSEPNETIWSKIKRITKEEVGNATGAGSQGAVPKASDGRDFKKIRDTSLNDLFNADAAINSDYPHVAITITDYSDRIVGRGMNLTSEMQRNDCIMFDAVIWRTAKQREDINDVIYCVSDGIKGFMRGAFDGAFRFASTTNANTGQRGTTGPLPPANIYPRGVEDDRLLDGPGYALMGNILMAMGFDFTYGGNTGRVWVVSTTNKPGT